MSPDDRARFFSRLRSYVYVYCEVDKESRRIPFYNGKGTGPRCFDHLNERGSSKKIKRIRHLMSTDRLDIDILAYGLDNRTAQEIESACIDLMGIDEVLIYCTRVLISDKMKTLHVWPDTVTKFPLYH